MKTATEQELSLVAQALERLSILAKSLQIYGEAHHRTMEARALYEEFSARIAELDVVREGTLQVAYHDGRLFLENMPLPQRGSKNVFHRVLRRHRLGGFQLKLNAEQPELDALLVALRREEAPQGLDVISWMSSDEVHKRARSKSYVGGRANLFLGFDDLRLDVKFCDGILHSMAGAMESCAQSDVGDLSPLLGAGDELVRRFITNSRQVMPLTTIPYFDDFTYHHSLNVSLLSMTVAQSMNCTPEQLNRICQAGLLHDMGKSRVPAEILYKPARLNDAEAAIVQKHPVDGAKILSRFPEIDPLAVSVAWGHHIKDGGRGYPTVGGKFTLSPIVRLVEVVDIFEALTAHRPYKDPLSATQAFDILYSMPNMDSFHPYMDLLLRAVGYNPCGSRVKTADGEVAVVVGHEDDNPMRPVIRPIEGDSENPTLGESRVGAAAAGSDRTKVTENTVTALDPEEDAELLAVAE
ncbi:MAG: HD domain-containing phosphohydrolase [Planctomycetota bacterium]